jgi:Ca2+-binding EF-hand superfamily protein
MADNPDADIAAYMAEADTDQDGSIDFQEFLSLWYKNVSAKAVQEFKKF